MSEWKVRLVQIEAFGKHPNADTLSITDIEGYPVIFRTGYYEAGEKVVYVPVDSIMPDTPENFDIFGKRLRVKAKKLRGIYSQGYLMKCPEALLNEPLGTIVHQHLGITKYDPEEVLISRGVAESLPKHFVWPSFDLEGLRPNKHVLEIGEEVVITEKIHGAQGKWCWDGERLWVGSKGQIKKYDPKLWWWNVASKHNLGIELEDYPKHVFLGEVFGRGVQDLKYDTDITFRFFDVFDGNSGRFLDWDVAKDIIEQVGLKTVPELYRGPWLGFDEHKHLAEGPSTLANHVREGFVVKTATEKYSHAGRHCFKLVGEGYLLR